MIDNCHGFVMHISCKNKIITYSNILKNNTALDRDNCHVFVMHIDV